MGVTKKPAVVTKAAPKKRGRPPGSMNKTITAKVDWEKLSRRLQEALAKEMKITQTYEKAGFLKRLEFLFTGKM
jgi:hypothetical protein